MANIKDNKEKEFSDRGDAEKTPNMGTPWNLSFTPSSNLEPLQLSANPTLFFHDTHQENTRTVPSTSEPDQETRPIESKWALRERMGDSNAAACHAFHTSSLLTLQSSQSSVGPQALKPCCSALASYPRRLNNWNTHLRIFSRNWFAYLELKTFIPHGLLFLSSDLWSALKAFLYKTIQFPPNAKHFLSSPPSHTALLDERHSSCQLTVYENWQCHHC